jgi:hypothetical protein
VALTDNRNLPLPYLVAHIALARVPGAGAVEESVTERDPNSIPGVADARASNSR